MESFNVNVSPYILLKYLGQVSRSLFSVETNQSTQNTLESSCLSYAENLFRKTIGCKNVVSEDRWSLVTGLIVLTCRTWVEYPGLSRQVVSHGGGLWKHVSPYCMMPPSRPTGTRPSVMPYRPRYGESHLVVRIATDHPSVLSKCQTSAMQSSLIPNISVTRAGRTVGCGNGDSLMESKSEPRGKLRSTVEL